MEISPEGINNILPSGSISGDTRTPVYLGYGGEVTLTLIHSSNPNLELWEESIGKLTISGTTSIGEFPQWHKFIFYLLNTTTGEKFYTEFTTEIIWGWGGETIDFYPSHQPGTPYPWNPEDWWKIHLDIDYSLAAMPPEEILNYLGNPFIPTEPLEMPIDGSLRAFITKVGNKNNTQLDELWIDIPGTQLIQDNIGNYLYESFDLGHMTAGDSIRFFLRTQNSIVSGMNLYPKQIREEIFLPDGDILLWQLKFEDWTDCRFDDVEVEIYLTPDSIGAFPGQVAVTIEPVEIAPGDTAEIIIQRRYLDGTLEDFSQWQTFEIGMIDGCDAGLILSDGMLEPYFEEVYQPIYFVAESNVTENTTVAIRVGLVQHLGGKPISNGGWPGDTDKETKKSITNKRRTADEKMMQERRKVELYKTKNSSMNPPLENPTGNYCFIGEFYTTLLGDGDVVVGDECENLSAEYSEINYLLEEQPEFFKVPHSDFEELKLDELIQVCNDDAYPNQEGGAITVDYKRYRYDYTTNSFKNFWILEPYKGTDDRVHYYFVNPQTNEATPLLFDFVTGVCYLKINPPGHPPYTLIANISDVDDDSKIPSDDYEQAFFDFCGHLCYSTEKATYVLVDILEIHEREHMRDFEDIVVENFPQLIAEIENYSDLCQSYDETVRQNAEKVIYSKMVRFIKNAIIEYNVISGKPGTPEETEHERSIQGRESITNRIEDYKDALVSRFITQLIGKNCQKCSYQ